MRDLHNLEELMKYFTHTLALTGLIASLGTGVFAQDVDPRTVTCSDFMAMSPEDQSDAMDAMKAAKMDAGGDAATSTDSETSAEGAATTDTDAASSDTATATEGGSASSTDTTSSVDVPANPEMEALLTSCEGKDDALVMNQMGSM